ncbi:2-isopropylmalate synthase (plasmid) [Streptomyces sp. BHT-5-2]|nr:2-isopropylmalate synthase [Streptomyces sp. BHT-5-2]QZL09008.1 2-isopropylmalate synthase [Streptomyces sp. BHT-5-2]
MSSQEQHWWNPQRASAMPVARYRRTEPRLAVDPADRQWPARTIDRAPLWSSVDLRDGNQALAHPMGMRRKNAMFDLLVRMGFKDIEVGYPSASQADFDFVRHLVTADRIPDDVTISVFTPARPELIDRTFEAIRGAERAMVHLCNATAPVWRDVVFQMSPAEIRSLSTTAAEHVLRRADEAAGSRLRFEYSPEAFNLTEADFVLDVCNEVTAIWAASPDRPVTVNLPTTVEADSPNVFADQVEWMHRHLDNRENLILSVHPHNDRGTGVASAELALLAGADRIEGTLFGNGERTGNVCLVTLALNLFSRGIDPQLDLGDIDAIRETVEDCNQLPVHHRHPYGGGLVYTAFSGTHQDAIKKGLAALDERARECGTATADIPWNVPYLPIDPKDVGRSYESVIRVNSQSGKGGVSYVIEAHYGLSLPRPLQVELAKLVQGVADQGDGEEHLEETELGAEQLWEIFRDAYLSRQTPLALKEFTLSDEGADAVRVEALLLHEDGTELRCKGGGPDAGAAFAAALTSAGHEVRLRTSHAHPVAGNAGTGVASYAEVTTSGGEVWGVGLEESATAATLKAVLSAVNRSL